MTVPRAIALLVAAAMLSGCGGGERLSGDDLPQSAAALRVSSAAFIDGSQLPREYTRYGLPTRGDGTVDHGGREGRNGARSVRARPTGRRRASAGARQGRVGAVAARATASRC